MADPLTLEVPESLEGARVDKAIATLLGVSRATARALLDEGVTVDGRPARPGDRVGPGSRILTPAPTPTPDLQPEEVTFPVLFEDEMVLVIDKPSGITVHPGSGRQTGTLAAGLLHRYPELEGVGDPGRWGLVHRLDRETSGTLIVARTTFSYTRLSADIAARHIDRHYTALARNRFPVPTGTIDAPIGPDPSLPTRRAVVATGKPAVTHYEVVEELADGEVSVLAVRLETGRTHQIRVHLAAIDHPILGDRSYSSTRSRFTGPRVMLHARSVAFDHPGSGERTVVDAPMPEDMRTVLAELRSASS